jgi:hypothetical protein
MSAGGYNLASHPLEKMGSVGICGIDDMRGTDCPFGGLDGVGSSRVVRLSDRVGRGFGENLEPGEGLCEQVVLFEV